MTIDFRFSGLATKPWSNFQGLFISLRIGNFIFSCEIGLMESFTNSNDNSGASKDLVMLLIGYMIFFYKRFWV